MPIDRRHILGASLLAALPLPVNSQSPPPSHDSPPKDSTEVLPLWPNGPAGNLNPARQEVSTPSGNTKRFVTGVSQPRLTIYRPPKPNGAAMLVIPGGGYRFVSIDNEGHEIARWLAAHGVTAFILTYRLPAEGWATPHLAPLADAQRAIRLIRHHHKSYSIDPDRTAVIGFSAGGHLCASLATLFDHPAYTPVDTADSLSARPALFVPIYPVISMTAGTAHSGSRTNLIGASPSDEAIEKFSLDKQVSPATPPAFIAHSEDDATVPVANALLLREALKAHNIKVETHLFAEGGHGYGLNSPKAKWGDLFLSFARARGLLA
ncbi:alpha/beta hydrolase [Asticcacaulis machinosus]|uniref:Alpha/beta hydrolase n=1 Tax=Asticcacaulis machinosus TaxID=2984211 RepID=A0ABT5HM43_9CAUL|nr:alpha/beta hydrolase [Asticcacaulis machinosus]MDC7677317.1 alpha/beta hydrolase [Asticcacaulis machinosus]